MIRTGTTGREGDGHLAASLDALKADFLAAAKRGELAADSPRLWRAMIDNPWFQHELDRAAAMALLSVQAPLAWSGDVRNHALLLLRAELGGSLNMKLDERRAQQSFAAWLRSVLRHVCQRAVRYQLRQARPHADLTAAESARPADLALLVDVALAIDALDEPARAILSLMMDGHSLSKAAEMLGLTRKAARRAHDKAIERLRRALRAYGDE
jgi:hypothetical protein